MALYVESAWGDKFKEEIKKATREGSYRPHWYHGGSFASASSFNHTINNNFSNAIGASSSPSGST